MTCKVFVLKTLISPDLSLCFFQGKFQLPSCKSARNREQSVKSFGEGAAPSSRPHLRERPVAWLSSEMEESFLATPSVTAGKESNGGEMRLLSVIQMRSPPRSYCKAARAWGASAHLRGEDTVWRAAPRPGPNCSPSSRIDNFRLR